ncbi:histidine phosphatase superfamily, partial [Phakopsora pachyrhizi]
SPFHRFGNYKRQPSSCELDRVIQIQRHGSRYPTSRVNDKIQRSLNKIKKIGDRLDKSLEFIKSYRFFSKDSDLVELGRKESYLSGEEFYSRYRDLINKDLSDNGLVHLPFLRSSQSDRVIQSAELFKIGLIDRFKSQRNFEEKILIISEDPKDAYNSKEEYEYDDEKGVWLKLFIRPILKRFNEHLAVGSDLNEIDVLSLMQLCLFDSVAKEEQSKFCDIFHEEEWINFEYYFDLDKYFKHGIGNEIASSQGVGYLAELLSRLTGDIDWIRRDFTKVNHTLDESEDYFPLNRKTFVDFSHDNQMVSIFSSLGIQPIEDLPIEGPPPTNRSFVVAQWVPFASRLTVERMKCRQNHHSNSSDQLELYLRIFLVS